jgi:hypothetical protein
MSTPAYAYRESDETWYRIQETARSGSGEIIIKSKTAVPDESEVPAEWRPNRIVESGDFEVLR